MWKVYLRQIVRLLRENKFFSVVYILGTVLSVAMMMLILITYHIKTGNIGEEDKRDRTAYITRGYGVHIKDGSGNSSAFLSPFMIEKWFYPVKTAEIVCNLTKGSSLVYNAREQRYEELSATYTDAAFWKLFSLRFVAGRGFNDAEVKGKSSQVVMDVTTARRIFGTTDAVGRSVNIDWQDYTVCGIVADVPTYLADASSRIYVPYTTNAYAYREWGSSDVKVGPAFCLFLMPSHDDLPALKQELEHQVRMMNAPCKKYCFSLREQPTDILGQALKLGNPDVSVEGQRGTLRAICIILALFLIVPALNLSSLIVARLRKRAEEIGVRKAFGASTANLMLQVLVENFVQMLLGGAIGLLLSYGMFQVVRSALLANLNSLFQGGGYEGISTLSFWHVIDLTTVGYVLVICFVLNLVSTLLPAWRYARVPIVDALNKR